MHFHPWPSCDTRNTEPHSQEHKVTNVLGQDGTVPLTPPHTGQVTEPGRITFQLSFYD